MKPGTYVLTRDVVNPHPDRRYTRDWRYLPVWPKGMKIVAAAFRYRSDNSEVIEIRRLGEWSTHYFQLDSEQGMAIAAALEPVERTLKTVLAAHDLDGPREHVEFIIAQLLKMGRITLDDVDAAIEAHNEEMRAEDEAWRAARAAEKGES